MYIFCGKSYIFWAQVGKSSDIVSVSNTMLCKNVRFWVEYQYYTINSFLFFSWYDLHELKIFHVFIINYYCIEALTCYIQLLRETFFKQFRCQVVEKTNNNFLQVQIDWFFFRCFSLSSFLVFLHICVLFCTFL